VQAKKTVEIWVGQEALCD